MYDIANFNKVNNSEVFCLLCPAVDRKDVKFLTRRSIRLSQKYLRLVQNFVRFDWRRRTRLVEIHGLYLSNGKQA